MKIFFSCNKLKIFVAISRKLNQGNDELNSFKSLFLKSLRATFSDVFADICASLETTYNNIPPYRVPYSVPYIWPQMNS